MLKRCFLGDLRRSAGLYILIAAVLTVMGVLTVNLSGNLNDETDPRIVKYFDDERFYDLSVLNATFFNNESYEQLLEEDVEKVGRYFDLCYDSADKSYAALEYGLADVYWFPLSEGEWFSGEEPQAIVPESMAEKYALGSEMEVIAAGGSVTVTVVGYSENDGAFCDVNIFGNETKKGPFIAENSAKITLCIENVEIFIDKNSEDDDMYPSYVLSLSVEEKDHYTDKYVGLSLHNMGETFDSYLYSRQPFIALNIYMLYAMIAGCIVVAVTVSVSAGEVNRRRLGVTMLCGATRRNLMICEAIRGAVCAVIAIAVTAVLGTTFGESEMLKMAAEDIWKGVMAILATGAVICAAGVIRIAKTKILDLISGR